MSTRVVPELKDLIERIEGFAHYHVRQLVRSGRLPEEEHPDFVQDLLVHVVKQWPQLAGNDFEPLGFARLVIRQKSSNELRRRQSLKAKSHRANDRIGENFRGEVADCSRHSTSSAQKKLDQALDSLPDADRQVVELVLRDGAAKAAEQLGLSTRQLNCRRKRIGEQLEKLL